MSRTVTGRARAWERAVAFFVWAGVLLPGCPPRQDEPDPHYSIVTIHEGHGRAEGINVHGEVVGSFRIYTPGKLYFQRAFLWRPTGSPKLTDLGTLEGGTSVAYDINDFHVVCGYSDYSYLYHAVRWTPQDGIQDLGTLSGGNSSIGYAINNDGQIVGDAGDSGGFYRAFIWTESEGMKKIGNAEQGTHAFDISESSVAVGSVRDAISIGTPYPPEARGWKATGEQYALPNTLGGDASMAFGVNAGGETVGIAETTGGYIHAMSWSSPGPMKNLGSLGYCDGSKYCSAANAINYWGDIVGAATSESGAHHAVLWKDGTLYDLNDLIPAGTDWVYLKEAEDINNKGCIVGTGLLNIAGTVRHAPFLLVPVVLETLTLDSSDAVGGEPVLATVSLDSEAPIDLEIELTLSARLAPIVQLPPDPVVIPDGDREVSFNLITNSVRATVSGVVTARFGGNAVSAALTVTAL